VLAQFKLFIVSFDDVWVIDKFMDIFSGSFVMLKTLAKEQNSLEGQLFFDRLSKSIVTSLNFLLEFCSIFSMERCLAFEQFE